MFFGLIAAVALWRFQPTGDQRIAPPQNEELKKFIDAQSSIGAKENPHARSDYELLMLVDPRIGRIPQGIKTREGRYARTLPTREFVNRNYRARSTAALEATEWESRGPWNVGGRTRALAIDIKNENIILSGGVSGGMWRTTNGGASWTKVTSPESHHSVTCIVQDTRPGKEHIWYYGTGELQGNSARGGDSPYRGDGLFKSTDNGQTWAPIESTTVGEEHKFNSQFQYIWNLAVNESTMEQDEIYAAIFGGIARSVDGGETWDVTLGRSLLSSSSDLNSAAASEYTDIAIAKNNVLYATLSRGTNPGPEYGVFMSENGIAWEEITPDEWPNFFGRTVIGVSESDPNMVYFMCDSEPYTLWRYLRDPAGGPGTWTDLSQNIPKFGEPVGDYNSQKSYNMVIAVHPEDPDVVYLGGTNLYRTTDGFNSTENNAWIGGYDTLNDRSIYKNHYVDQHALVFYRSNPDKMLSGNDGGVFITDNNLAENITWRSLNNGYITSQFYTIAIDQSRPNDIILGGLQDNGSYMTASDDPVGDWTRIIGGDGGYCAVSRDGYYYYFSFQMGETYRITLNAKQEVTSFARIDPPDAGQRTGQDVLFVNPFVLDPNNNNRIYFAGGDRIWRNNNVSQIPVNSQEPSSVNWTDLPGTQIPDGSISSLGVSTLPAGILYYGSTNGRLYKITDATALSGNIKAIDITHPAFPEKGYLSNISVDPSDANRVMVVFSNYNVLSIFYSEDGGGSFVSVSGNLEEKPDGVGAGPSVRWSQVIPLENDQHLYLAGTSVGLFSTTHLDGMDTQWAKEGESMIGNTVVPMLAYRSIDGLVAVATHGNGIYTKKYNNVKKIDITSEPEPLRLVHAYPNPFSDIATIHYNLPGSGMVRIHISNAIGDNVKQLVWAYQYEGENQATWDGTDDNGTTVSPGLYIIYVTLGDQTAATKVIYR